MVAPQAALMQLLFLFFVGCCALIVIAVLVKARRALYCECMEMGDM